jgi:hypothetical protein
MEVLPLATWTVAIVYFSGPYRAGIADDVAQPYFISLTLEVDF